MRQGKVTRKEQRVAPEKIRGAVKNPVESVSRLQCVVVEMVLISVQSRASNGGMKTLIPPI